MANGQRITRSVGFAIVRFEDHFTVDEVVFAEEGDLSLLGARSLEGLNLTVDSRLKKLVASGPLPAAAVGMDRIELRVVIANALAKDGWTISHEPFLPPPLVHGDIENSVVERAILACRGGEKIALIPLEIDDSSDLDSVYEAIGGHALLRSLMTRSESDRLVYIAVSKEGASVILCRPSIMKALGDLQMPFVICDREKRRILRWGLLSDGGE